MTLSVQMSPKIPADSVFGGFIFNLRGFMTIFVKKRFNVSLFGDEDAVF